MEEKKSITSYTERFLELANDELRKMSLFANEGSLKSEIENVLRVVSNFASESVPLPVFIRLALDQAKSTEYLRVSHFWATMLEEMLKGGRIL